MKKIMITDDSAIQRSQVKKLLEKYDYTVVEAQDGQDGFEKAKEDKDIQLFIVDFNMPNLNGLEMIAQLRELDDYKNTPIFMLTTQVQETFRNEARRLGVVAWVIKPFVPEQLVKVVDKILKGVSFNRSEHKV